MAGNRQTGGGLANGKGELKLPRVPIADRNCWDGQGPGGGAGSRRCRQVVGRAQRPVAAPLWGTWP